MYSTCLFCHTDLGRNEIIEHFPIGRRLAFDAARGRLWVVCRACERWNLTPLDERWEAIEECERLFHDTKLRISTSNIGLARLAEGLELVRIGTPQLPEFAAWRYGDQFGRRRRAQMLRAGLGLGAFGVAVGGIVVAGFEIGISLGGAWWWMWRLGNNATRRIIDGSPTAVVARIPGASGAPIAIERRHLSNVVVRPQDVTGRWALEVMHTRGTTLLSDDQALRAARIVLPAINRFGATREQVSDAVRLIERVDSVSSVFARAASLDINAKPAAMTGNGAWVAGLSPAVRVALEMAAHDEVERRAMEGELSRLESEWREAEEIAGIADNLLPPEGAEEFLARNRKR